LRTFQAFRFCAVLERLLAGWTNQHFQEVFGNHDWAFYDTGWSRHVTRLTVAGSGNHHRGTESTKKRSSESFFSSSNSNLLRRLRLIRFSMPPW